MKLTRDQVMKLNSHMSEEDISEVEIKENGSGQLRFYVPETKLVQFPLQKRTPRKSTVDPLR